MAKAGKTILTNHARDMLRKRSKNKGAAAGRIASKAWAKGLTKSDVNGDLRRYLDSRACKNRASEPRIWAGQVFVYTDKAVLVTVYPIPGNLAAKAAKALKKKDQLRHS